MPTVSGPSRAQCGASITAVSELLVESDVTGEDAPPVPLAVFFALGEHATTFSFTVGTHTEANYVQGTSDPVVEHIAPLSTEHDGIVSMSGCMAQTPVIEHVTSRDGILGGTGLVTSLLSDGCVEAPATPVMGRSHHDQTKSEGTKRRCGRLFS